MEPSASPNATSGVVDAHRPGTEEIGVGSGVQLTDKCGELFLLMSAGSGLQSYVSDALPQRGVDVVSSGLKLSLGVW